MRDGLRTRLRLQLFEHSRRGTGRKSLLPPWPGRNSSVPMTLAHAGRGPQAATLSCQALSPLLVAGLVEYERFAIL